MAPDRVKEDILSSLERIKEDEKVVAALETKLLPQQKRS